MRVGAYFILLLTLSANAHAAYSTGYSPKKTALAGAGRSGVLSESSFVNPAALANLKVSEVFAYYAKSRISDWNAGGKAMVFGAYDGENEFIHAGIAYVKEARVRLVNKANTYADRNEVRMSFGHSLSDTIDIGFTAKYITRRNLGEETKLFNGDIGMLLQLFGDFPVGITYEDFLERSGERPPVLSVGGSYRIWEEMSLYFDGGTVTKGLLKNKKSWAIGAELPLMGEILLEGGIFSDAVVGMKGKSIGVMWQGPRTTFHYALRLSNGAPVERDHVFAISIQI